MDHVMLPGSMLQWNSPLDKADKSSWVKRDIGGKKPLL